MNVRNLMLGWFAMLVVATPAWSYTPHVGDRAAPLSGTLVDGTTVALDDFRGKWVVLEFWSTTCGPCIRQMPALLEATSPYRDREELELLLINLNRNDMIAEAKTFVKENKIDCPVIIAGNSPILIGPEPPENYLDYIAPLAIDWSIRSLPSYILVNPDGVIAAKHVKPAQLEELLHLLIDGEDYLSNNFGCRSFVQLNSDGQAEILVVDLWSPMKQPLMVTVNFTFIDASLVERNGFTMPSRRKFIRKNPDEDEFAEIVTFAGETSHILRIPIDLENYLGIQYKILVQIPGTQELDGGLGIWSKQSGNFLTGFPTYSYET